MKYSKVEKDKLLYALFVLRAVTKHDLLHQFKKDDKQNLHTALNNFKNYEYIKDITTPNGHHILYITPKGYKYIVEKVLKTENPQYAYSGSKTKRSPLHIHHYMNFKFVWDYVHKNWDKILENHISIFTDQDINNCKLSTNYSGERLVIRPDVLINMQNDRRKKDVVLVENDTGRENPINIYRKFLQYAMFLKEGKRYLDINNVDLYFISLSEKRLENIFQTDTVVKRFEWNIEYKNWDIEMEDIINAFKTNTFRLYITTFKNYKPKEINILDTLAQSKDSWTKLI